MDMLEGDALVSSLMSNRTDSLTLEGVVDPVILPRAQPLTIELVVLFCLKQVTRCSTSVSVGYIHWGQGVTYPVGTL